MAEELGRGAGSAGPQETNGAGRRASLYLLFFPTAVFLVAPYSESLFLAGAIPAFYYARRKRWIISGMFAAVAMGARAAGIFLVVRVAGGVRAPERDFSGASLRRALMAAVIALLPLAAFAGYLWQVKGDPLYFFTDQRLGWGREFSGPLEALRTTWDATRVDAGEGAFTNFVIGWRVEIAAVALGILAVLWAIIKREWGYAGFMGAATRFPRNQHHLPECSSDAALDVSDRFVRGRVDGTRYQTTRDGFARFRGNRNAGGGGVHSSGLVLLTL